MRIATFLPLPLLIALSACASPPPVPTGAGHAAPPAILLGEFSDDYGIAYRIDAGEWWQRPAARYRVVAWHPEAQYLIARDSAGLWTRIDWMPLDGMPPYRWAFCLSAWDAKTRAEAERSAIADRSAPKTGCNGFPFSRMRPAPAG